MDGLCRNGHICGFNFIIRCIILLFLGEKMQYFIIIMKFGICIEH